jgi:hypothetical protein
MEKKNGGPAMTITIITNPANNLAPGIFFEFDGMPPIVIDITKEMCILLINQMCCGEFFRRPIVSDGREIGVRFIIEEGKPSKKESKDADLLTDEDWDEMRRLWDMADERRGEL